MRTRGQSAVAVERPVLTYIIQILQVQDKSASVVLVSFDIQSKVIILYHIIALFVITLLEQGGLMQILFSILKKKIVIL